MTDRVVFDVGRIKSLIAEIDRFNSFNLADVDLIEDGVKIELSEKVLDSWRFVGLSNKSFIEIEYWKCQTEPLIF